MNNMQKAEFETVYQTYYRRISLYVSKRISNCHEAEDLTGEIFAVAYRYFPNFNPAKSSVASWLFVIANSRLCNYYRDRKPPLYNLADFTDILSVPESDYSALETAVTLQSYRNILAGALAQLPERSRKLLILRFFEEKSTDAIAQALAITPQNVRVVQMRALNQLKTIIQGKNLLKEDY